MMKNTYESFEMLVEALQQVPSIGKKSAMRLGYFLAIENKSCALKLAYAIENAVSNMRLCQECGGICEDEQCELCVDVNRCNGELCIVEHPKDIITLEESRLFEGRYFVIGSIDDFRLEKLCEIIQRDRVREVIFAFSPSVATDALILYIEDQLNAFPLLFTRIAQGVPSGVSFENVDQLSLLKAFRGRKEL